MPRFSIFGILLVGPLGTSSCLFNGGRDAVCDDQWPGGMVRVFKISADCALLAYIEVMCAD